MVDFIFTRNMNACLLQKCKIYFWFIVFLKETLPCFHSGSNWGPSACEADVITTTLWKLHSNVELFWNDYKILTIISQLLVSIHNICKYVTPNGGLEPPTLRLRVSCSTDWASQAWNSILFQCNKPSFFDDILSCTGTVNELLRWLVGCLCVVSRCLILLVIYTRYTTSINRILFTFLLRLFIPIIILMHPLRIRTEDIQRVKPTW